MKGFCDQIQKENTELSIYSLVIWGLLFIV